LWTAPVALPFVPQRPTHWVVATWLMQPMERTAAAVTGFALGIGGVLVYALLGPRSRRL
jgi:hypothetical protein